MEYDIGPWGEYLVLEDAKTHKTKKIKGNQGNRLSLQYYYKRGEVWTILSGVGAITINEQIKDYTKGEDAEIPRGAHHRIENRATEPVFFVDLQYRVCFGKNHIVCIEDDYNRI